MRPTVALFVIAACAVASCQLDARAAEACELARARELADISDPLEYPADDIDADARAYCAGDPPSSTIGRYYACMLAPNTWDAQDCAGE